MCQRTNDESQRLKKEGIDGFKLREGLNLKLTDFNHQERRQTQPVELALQAQIKDQQVR